MPPRRLLIRSIDRRWLIGAGTWWRVHPSASDHPEDWSANENRDLQRERGEWAAARAVALVGRGGTGRGVPTRVESSAGKISSTSAPGSRIWRGLARPEELERGRHSRSGHRPNRDYARPPWRSRRHAQPIH